MKFPVALSPRIFLLTGLAFALVGCVGNPLQTATGEQAILSGELSMKSKVNANNGSRYQSFPLRLRGGEAVDVHQSESLGTLLTLLDAQGRLISGPGAGALILAPGGDGAYTLNVSGEDALTYGPFRLSLRRQELRNNGSLVAGDKVVGRLDGAGNQYQLEVKEPAIYTLTMDSADFDTSTSLEGEGVFLENDDFGEGTNSQIHGFLQPGQYLIRAASVEDTARGTFSLGLTRRVLPVSKQVRNSGVLEEGKTVTGVASMTPAQYELEVKHAALVHLGMRSGEIDSFLELTGNAFSASDDDSGNDHDAKLSQLLLPGRYQVSAQSVNGQAGLFELHYSQSPVQQGSLRQLEAGQFALGRLSSSQVSGATVRIRKAGEYVFDLASSDFDALLELVGNGFELQDDDSAGGTNARISRYLDAGEYQLKIGAVAGGSGRFVVAVRSEN